MLVSPFQNARSWLRAAALLGVLLLAAGLFQHAAGQQLGGYGVRGGVALAQVRGGTFSGVQVGGAAVVSARIDLGGGFALQPELAYLRKGGGGTEDEIEDTLPVGDFDLRIQDVGVEIGVQADYAEVPLLLRYALAPAGRVGVSLYAGPYAAVALTRAVDIGVRGDFTLRDAADEVLFDQTFEEYQDLERILELINALGGSFGGGDVPASIDAARVLDRFDYGLTLGADLGFALGGQRAVLAVRYDLGLPDLIQQDADDVQLVQEVIGAVDDFEAAGFEGKTSTLSVALGVAF